VVETIRLESGHTLTGIGGSNPSLSAMIFARSLAELGISAADSHSLALRSRLLGASSSNPSLSAIHSSREVC
jgi:hypothetical protein